MEKRGELDARIKVLAAEWQALCNEEQVVASRADHNLHSLAHLGVTANESAAHTEATAFSLHTHKSECCVQRIHTGRKNDVSFAQMGTDKSGVQSEGRGVCVQMGSGEYGVTVWGREGAVRRLADECSNSECCTQTDEYNNDECCTQSDEDSTRTQEVSTQTDEHSSECRTQTDGCCAQTDELCTQTTKLGADIRESCTQTDRSIDCARMGSYQGFSAQTDEFVTRSDDCCTQAEGHRAHDVQMDIHQSDLEGEMNEHASHTERSHSVKPAIECSRNTQCIAKPQNSRETPAKMTYGGRIIAGASFEEHADCPQGNVESGHGYFGSNVSQRSCVCVDVAHEGCQTDIQDIRVPMYMTQDTCEPTHMCVCVDIAHEGTQTDSDDVALSGQGVAASSFHMCVCVDVGHEGTQTDFAELCANCHQTMQGTRFAVGHVGHAFEHICADDGHESMHKQFAGFDIPDVAASEEGIADVPANMSHVGKQNGARTWNTHSGHEAVERAHGKVMEVGGTTVPQDHTVSSGRQGLDSIPCEKGAGNTSGEGAAARVDGRRCDAGVGYEKGDGADESGCDHVKLGLPGASDEQRLCANEDPKGCRRHTICVQTDDQKSKHAASAIKSLRETWVSSSRSGNDGNHGRRVTVCVSDLSKLSAVISPTNTQADPGLTICKLKHAQQACTHGEALRCVRCNTTSSWKQQAHAAVEALYTASTDKENMAVPSAAPDRQALASSVQAKTPQNVLMSEPPQAAFNSSQGACLPQSPAHNAKGYCDPNKTMAQVSTGDACSSSAHPVPAHAHAPLVCQGVGRACGVTCCTCLNQPVVYSTEALLEGLCSSECVHARGSKHDGAQNRDSLQREDEGGDAGSVAECSAADCEGGLRLCACESFQHLLGDELSSTRVSDGRSCSGLNGTKHCVGQVSDGLGADGVRHSCRSSSSCLDATLSQLVAKSPAGASLMQVALCSEHSVVSIHGYAGARTCDVHEQGVAGAVMLEQYKRRAVHVVRRVACLSERILDTFMRLVPVEMRRASEDMVLDMHVPLVCFVTFCAWISLSRWWFVTTLIAA
jgi:hypothetical protein